jgi:hypothetical protein
MFHVRFAQLVAYFCCLLLVSLLEAEVGGVMFI